MIYGLMDFELLQKYALSFENYIDRCKELDVAIIQYRDKISSFEEVKKNLLQIRKLWDKTLIINDYIDLVEFVDGVHIGQEDLKKYGSIANIRDKIARKLLGLSTHNKDEILKANQLDIDYIGLGAYRKTTTKDVLSIGGKNSNELGFFFLSFGGSLGVNFNSYGIITEQIGGEIIQTTAENNKSLYFSGVIEAFKYLDAEEKYGILLRTGFVISGLSGTSDINVNTYDLNMKLKSDYTDIADLYINYFPIMLGVVVNI